MTLPQLGTGAQLLEWPVTEREWLDFLADWELVPDVAVRALVLGALARFYGLGRLWIISGRRSEPEQEQLRRRWLAGELHYRPARRSLHLDGRAFDVGTDEALSEHEWELLGFLGTAIGLRWGGNFAIKDSPHFDR